LILLDDWRKAMGWVKNWDRMWKANDPVKLM
jgi:hypothetical protein